MFDRLPEELLDEMTAGYFEHKKRERSRDGNGNDREEQEQREEEERIREVELGKSVSGGAVAKAVSGDSSESVSGTNIAVGDINGDSYDDTVVGDSTLNKVYVYLGTQSSTGVRTPSSADSTIACLSNAGSCGSTVVIGDLTGDGYDEIAIGAPLSNGKNGNLSQAGEVYIIYGAPSLPASINVSSSDIVSIVYGTEAGWLLGDDMLFIDNDLNGTLELVCNLADGSAMIISYDLASGLGINLRLVKIKGETEFKNVQAVPVLIFKVSASIDEDLEVDKIGFKASGDSNELATVEEALLYKDVDRNGKLDTKVDQAIGQPQKFTQDDGNITFEKLAKTLSAGTTEQWMVVYRLK